MAGQSTDTFHWNQPIKQINEKNRKTTTLYNTDVAIRDNKNTKLKTRSDFDNDPESKTGEVKC